MKRTVTIEDDVARRLEEAAAKAGASVDELVNDLLRESIGVAATRVASRPFQTPSRTMGLRPDVDPTKLGQWFDDDDDRQRIGAGG